MTQATEQQGGVNRITPAGNGLHCLDVAGWSFARIHRVLDELGNQGWRLASADTDRGTLMLFLRHEAREAV